MKNRSILLAFTLLGMATPSLGQTPTFEVTSVRPIKIAAGQRRNTKFDCSNGRFVSMGRNLRPALLWAFSIRPFQVTGLPQGIDSPEALFDIEAKADRAVSEEECMLMVQTLLADRFSLAMHSSRCTER